MLCSMFCENLQLIQNRSQAEYTFQSYNQQLLRDVCVVGGDGWL